VRIGDCASPARASSAPPNPSSPTVRALDAYLADDHPRPAGCSFDRTKASQLSYVVAYKLIPRLAKRAGQGDGCVGPVGSASRTCIGGSPGGYPRGRYPDL